jgi:succinate dehydrogenase / fumarate reductase, membrane anchor subunit
MLLFFVFVLATFALNPRPSYLEWRAWASSPGVSIAMLAFFAALLSHMWVGLRDVLLDYAKPAWLCHLLLGLVAAGIVASGAWVVLIFVRLQT